MRTEYLEIYMAKVASLIQSRQKKEVKINEMSRYNRDRFRKATEKETRNNIQIGAYSPITLEESASIRQKNPERIMSSRVRIHCQTLGTDRHRFCGDGRLVA